MLVPEPEATPRPNIFVRAGRAVANFFLVGAHADAKAPHYSFYRHKLPVRIMHWTNAVVLLIMLMSGLQIFNAHPALYWGATSTFDTPAFAMKARRAPDGQLRGVTQLGDWSVDTTGVFGVSDFEGRPAEIGRAHV